MIGFERKTATSGKWIEVSPRTYDDRIPSCAWFSGLFGLPRLPKVTAMVYLSRIYTKSGDAGVTGLGDGNRVSKDHPRVVAYGEVDELNAVLGLVTAHCPDYAEGPLLRAIQNDLFDLGADLCVPQSASETPGACLRVTISQYESLERAIDRVNERLKPLHSFVLPGGSPVAAWLHLARTVCRRAERACVTLAKDETINEAIVIYLNRLSDLLFVLSRAGNDDGNADVLWVPGKNRGTD
jgi:cob(I)alamin adenosyltransferase